MSDIQVFPARIARAQPHVESLRNLIGDTGEADPFLWTAEISSDRLDAYHTHMAESTLRNFADDAAAGVAFLDSHNSRNLGYGQSLAGTFEVSDDISRVLADFYTIPGIRFRNGPTYESTDDFIKAVNARLVRDVSVGFYGGDMICDICGNDFRDWRNCDHWPGQEYAIGEQGDATVTATFTIEGARLAEVSAVYDGATPQAQIVQRATEMNAAGQMPPETALHLERQYRIKLPIASRVFEAKAKQRSKETMEPLEEIRAVLGEIEAEGETEVEQIRWLMAEIERLSPLADQGRQYREDLIADAVAEGVRAMGDQFPAETYETMLRSAPLEQVKQLRDSWAKQAAAKLAGGRKTVNEDETRSEPVRIVPDHAYNS